MINFGELMCDSENSWQILLRWTIIISEYFMHTKYLNILKIVVYHLAPLDL